MCCTDFLPFFFFVYYRELAREAQQNINAVTPPLFLRFINLLLNDAVFLLDEALANMAQLRNMQTARYFLPQTFFCIVQYTNIVLIKMFFCAGTMGNGTIYQLQRDSRMRALSCMLV